MKYLKTLCFRYAVCINTENESIKIGVHAAQPCINKSVQHKIIENLLCFLSFAWVDFFSSEDVLDIFTNTFIVQATKWPSRQAISSINSTCPRQENYARNQFWTSLWKFKLTSYPGSLSFSSLVVGMSGGETHWSDLITWPPGFWVVKISVGKVG